MPDYFDLGDYGRPVTTDSAQAQTWFDRGLVWAYAFNHEEAADQLAAARPEDLLRVPDPPMADWLEGFVAMRLHVLIRFGRWPATSAARTPASCTCTST